MPKTLGKIHHRGLTAESSNSTCQFVLEDLQELALADPVPVDDDPVGLVPSRRLVEHHEVLLDHGAQVLDDLGPVGLDPDGGGVPGRVGVLRAHHRRDRRLLVVARRRVSHVGAKENHWLVENLKKNRMLRRFPIEGFF